MFHKLGEVRDTFRLRRDIFFVLLLKLANRVVQSPALLLEFFYRLGYYLVGIQGLDVGRSCVDMQTVRVGAKLGAVAESEASVEAHVPLLGGRGEGVECKKSEGEKKLHGFW